MTTALQFVAVAVPLLGVVFLAGRALEALRVVRASNRSQGRRLGALETELRVLQAELGIRELTGRHVLPPAADDEEE